jgi:hypothetical protein
VTVGPRALVLALLIVGVLAGPAAAARPAARYPVPALAGAPLGARHDTIVRGGPARAAAGRHGGFFTAKDGTRFKVYESPSFAPDDRMLQAWADYFGGLVHGKELKQLTLYLAPLKEVEKVCGDVSGADSCYDPDANEITLIGQAVSGHDSPEAIGAHEYGHHVANHRHNDLGDAMDWGPTYWGSYEDVCDRVDERTAFPGDEDKHYTENPGEAWAEVYRVANAQEPNLWDVVDDSWQPNRTAIAKAKADVRNPYDGGEYVDRRGSFGRKGSPWRHVRAPVENDGTVDLRLTSTGSLDADLYVFATRKSRRPIDKATRRGHKETLVGDYCGYRWLDVRVKRKRGSGRYKLRLTLPYVTTP